MNAIRVSSRMMFLWIFLSGVCIWNSSGSAKTTDPLRHLPVQDGGRIKPFDTLALEALELVHGKKTYEGKPAHEIVMTWLLEPTSWETRPLVEIRNSLVRSALKLPQEQVRFSPQSILSNDRLSLIFQELNSKRESKAKLDPYFQDVQRLESQLLLLKGMASGHMLKIVAPQEGDSWLSVVDMPEQFQSQFQEIAQAFVGALADSSKSLAEQQKAEERLGTAVGKFRSHAANYSPQYEAAVQRVETEVLLNRFHPFMWAWMLYSAAAVSLALIWVLKKRFLYPLAWVLSLGGLALHVFGFGLRMYLAGRPPVSNMYETVVWVGFGGVVFSMIFEAIYRWKFVLLAGSLVGAFCLILGDLAPNVLDPTLQPLEAVLRSHFWLTVHVLTITISYAAFFLAFVLGDIGLVFFAKGETQNQEQLRALSLAAYRSVQVGVSLLAPGIILGGIWADYSWGRFWGWDPKETWALIALLGYLALLHARVAGYVKELGFLCWSVITFSLVIMAWYGVNFVLGAGLHSYGFGAGGVEYVAGFVAVHLVAVVFVSQWTLVRRRMKSHDR